jgi:glycopeptide antibiotics resistance protein
MSRLSLSMHKELATVQYKSCVTYLVILPCNQLSGSLWFPTEEASSFGLSMIPYQLIHVSNWTVRSLQENT